MIENVQIFLVFIGLTLFCGGGMLCFIASSFRYGVFCTIVANALFIAAIVFPIQITTVLSDYGLTETLKNIDVEVLKIKSIMLGIILMGGLWGIRWLKHLITSGLLYFLFPSIAKPKILEKK